MTTIKTEGFKIPGRPMPRPDLRRPFSDGSLAVDTHDLTSITPMISPFGQAFQYQSMEYQPQPVYPAFTFEQPHSLESRSPPRTSLVGKAPKIKQRKLSMTESRPRERMPARAMSFSHPEKINLGINLGTHHESIRTDSISPPEYYGMAIPHIWDSASSVPSVLPSSMQSFGTTVDEAILDSPITPAPLMLSDDEQKKQRRRECHNLVEKRRREHINAKIEELSQLLPPQYNLDEAVDDEEEEHDIKKKKGSGSSSTKAKDASQCKGHVLTQSVAYIHDLRHVTQAQASRIQQLEAWLASSGYSHPVIPPVIWEQQTLEPMRQSPEAEPLQTMSWAPVELPADYRRSSSASSQSYAQPSEPSPPSPHRHRERSMRTDLEADLPISMSGMELDSMFVRRDEDHGGMRW